jgi:hypothetical protein
MVNVAPFSTPTQEAGLAQQETRQAYETPMLTRIGTFEEVTRQTTAGDHLDVALPAGTPLSEVLTHIS